jgi:KUP system potassium uptake protein
LAQTAQETDNTTSGTHSGMLALSIGAIGVVYGDIGTSPLYTMREVFNGIHGVAPEHDNVLGVLSLITWALIVVVSLKYAIFIMRADNRGEGGIMALLAVALRTPHSSRSKMALMTVLGMFGAALFYGDGVITPAISVLSAVEGLEIAAPGMKTFVIPITVVVITGLFLFQRRGTASVGALFGPVMIVWFTVLAVLGIVNIIAQPSVLLALSPLYALGFAAHHQMHAFLALGAVVLAVTGAEALYADMGHFGRSPIRRAWFIFVLPALLLNYYGQGALIITSPATVSNPFYLMAPDWFLYPMVLIATLATIIASQAVISGAFSLTRQAMTLGYAPRMTVLHTSSHEIGQIYVPVVNWMLFVSVIALVLGFKSSSALASAYGIAVTGTMIIDTILAFIVVRALWGWSRWRAGLFLALFLAVDIAFFSANTVKILDGGWFPLILGLFVFTFVSTWRRGRELLRKRMRADGMPLDTLIASLAHHPPHRVPGTSIFMTTDLDAAPRAMLHNIYHNKVLHERVVLMTVAVQDIPHVPDAERVRVECLQRGFYRVLVSYGFKDSPNIPRAMELCGARGLEFRMMETTFFLGRETVVPKTMRAMALWRQKLYIWMFRNAGTATEFFKIPTNRVVEMGTQVEL